jgi:hypothetical protein
LSRIKPVIWNFSTFCIVLIHTALLMQDIFHKTLGDIFSMTHTLQKYCKSTFYVKLNTCTLWLIKDKCMQLGSDCSGDKTAIVLASKRTQAETVCFEAQGHNKSTTLYI